MGECFVGAIDHQAFAQTVGEKANGSGFAPGHEISGDGFPARDRSGKLGLRSHRAGCNSNCAATGNRFDVHHERHRPGCDVVDLVRQTLGATAFLFLQKRSVHLDIGVQQGSNQALGGLCEVDDVAAGIERAATGAKRVIRSADLDTLAHQQSGELVGARLIVLCRQDIGPNIFAATLINGRQLIVVKLLQEFLTVVRNGFGRGERGQKVIAYRVGIGHLIAVVLADDEAARRGLFVGHRDAAEVGGPARAVTRVKRVEHFASEVVDTEFIEPAGIGLAEQFQAGALVRCQMRVERNGLGCEVVRGVGAHFVRVDKCDGPPLLNRIDAATCFGLRQNEPVAVHVEQIVVRAPTRRRLIVFGR